ncbi:hypothetical protein BKA91DRAFT_132443 [Yarrowia lipolytica]|nr:hypothetical protein BKA91DRAFT_132443 [Yarrowia lipolytica]KAE8172496.1 hypothetical protein BKA90DRAFT_137318 [Yarrowia lipolytica]RMI98497.1 hypothetical protein BD777DRAFT_124576 [Yarrowia lipolytica]
MNMPEKTSFFLLLPFSLFPFAFLATSNVPFVAAHMLFISLWFNVKLWWVSNDRLLLFCRSCHFRRSSWVSPD